MRPNRIATRLQTLPVPRLPFYALLLLVAAGVIVKCAWVGDDGFITFRTIENFVNGFGLTWNIAERVQTYTHPLWMIILTVLRLVTGDVLVTSIIISILFTIAAIAIVIFRIADKYMTAVFVVLSLIFVQIIHRFLHFRTRESPGVSPDGVDRI